MTDQPHPTPAPSRAEVALRRILQLVAEDVEATKRADRSAPNLDASPFRYADADVTLDRRGGATGYLSMMEGGIDVHCRPTAGGQ
jgi:hypothetical protein